MQQGSVIREHRKLGPDVWCFRWWEAGPNGNRVHRRIVLGKIFRRQQPFWETPKRRRSQSTSRDQHQTPMILRLLPPHEHRAETVVAMPDGSGSFRS